MLSVEESSRYRRQIPLLNEEGQERLQKANIVIGGAGGLGTVIATYLVAAGIGTVRIADYDMVEITNLNRQFLYKSEDKGSPKVFTLAKRLAALNPNVRVEAVCYKIEEDNVLDIVGTASLIVDAMDNFPARYLLNRVALSLSIPFVYGSVREFYGEVSTIIPSKTPCLRCIFPEPPPLGTSPVVGATCGVVGSIQATEVIKYITGQGQLLTSRLLVWDGLAGDVDIVRLEKNPNCPECKCLGVTKEKNL